MKLPRFGSGWKNAAAIVGVAAPYVVAFAWAFESVDSTDYLIYVAVPAYCQGAFFLATRLVLGPGSPFLRLLCAPGVATASLVAPAYLPQPHTASGYDLTEYALYAAYAGALAAAISLLSIALGERDARLEPSGAAIRPAKISLFELLASLSCLAVAAAIARTPLLAAIESAEAGEFLARAYDFATSRFLAELASAVVPTAIAARLVIRAGGRWFRVRLGIGAAFGLIAVGAWCRQLYGGGLTNVPPVFFLTIFVGVPLWQEFVLRLTGFRAVNVGILRRATDSQSIADSKDTQG